MICFSLDSIITLINLHILIKYCINKSTILQFLKQERVTWKPILPYVK